MLFALGMLTIARLLVFCALLRATNASKSCASKKERKGLHLYGFPMRFKNVSTSVPSDFHALRTGNANNRVPSRILCAS